jgi:hypothetical protein
MSFVMLLGGHFIPALAAANGARVNFVIDFVGTQMVVEPIFGF